MVWDEATLYRPSYEAPERRGWFVLTLVFVAVTGLGFSWGLWR